MRATTHRFALLGLAVYGAVSVATDAAQKLSPDQLEFFEKKIRPVLADRCYNCHSANAEKNKGGLLLDTREGVLKGGDSGPAIVPGNPNKSLLIKSIRQDDADLFMPPKGKGEKLTDEQIANFEKWVRMGAPDPRQGTAAVKPDVEKGRNHWAFKPVTKPEVPKVRDTGKFVQTPIDAFVLAKLREKGLEPSSPADKRTLIRRATYDLTGLPPTPQEVDDFLADSSLNAFAKLVDRLLASPRYGERWGRHWLDLARYADSSGDRLGGNRRNPLYPYAYTYRDYVINAFNNDLPYDQFIIQQIAADKLPEAQKDRSILAALGFLTVGKRFMNNQNEVIDDQIDVVTKGLMGLTASCARCHDHKFDPIPTRDYYSLHGIFNSTAEPSEGPLLVNPESNPNYKEFLQKVETIEQEVEEFRRSEATRFAAGMLEKSGDYLLAAHDGTRDKDRPNSFRLMARKRGLDSELAEIWLVTLKSLARKNDPVFGPWFRFAALSDKEFPGKSDAIAREVSSAGDSVVHPLVAKAFAGKPPRSLKEVAGIYTEILDKLRKELKLDPFVGLRQARNRQFKMERTQIELADINLESLRQYFFGNSSPVMPDPQQMERTLGVQFRNAENQIRNKIVQLEMSHPGSPARAMALQDASRPRDSRVFIRGEPRNLGPVVPRQFLEVLAGEDRKPFKEGSGRLELAREIASRDNPLTARVFVNRVWQHHFGEAIVRTPSDFGTRADRPTHPELLDWLATWFMDQGWSVKKLHRLIMLSSVYQQDSCSNAKGMQVDPTNQWLWRHNIQRLDFEAIRDSFLAVAGKLDLTMGGPSFQLSETRDNRSRYSSGNLTPAQTNPNRRTVYAMIDRASLPDMFNTFDFANPDMTTGERIMTTVPQQALFMMNGPFVAEQVRHILARAEVQSQDQPADRIRAIFRILLQRGPSGQEMKLAQNFLAEALAEENPVPAPESITLPNKPTTDQERRKVAKARKVAQLAQSTPRALNAWERFTQVMLLSNEMIFVN